MPTGREAHGSTLGEAGGGASHGKREAKGVSLRNGSAGKAREPLDQARDLVILLALPRCRVPFQMLLKYTKALNAHSKPEAGSLILLTFLYSKLRDAVER